MNNIVIGVIVVAVVVIGIVIFVKKRNK